VAELSAALPGSPGVDWLATHVHSTDEEHRMLQETLPVQIIHGDYAMSNVLLADGAVSAILDFEIAGIDMRVVDPVAGIMQSTVGWWDGSGGDREAEAFARGYARRWPLSAAEIEALPVLFRARALGSAIWRAGKWRRRQASLDDVVDRLEYGQRVDSHVAAHDPDWWS
jgi:homoserine kinase type II